MITDPGTDDHITLVASTGSASISAASYGTTASTLVYTITGATANNTSLTIAPTYATSGTGDITDASSNEMLNGETVSGTDGAKPAILSAATGDANSDGTVDRLTLTFSESVVITDPGTDDHITLVASTGSASISAASYGTTASTLVYTITGATANNTSLTIAPTYATSGTGDITDASSNEMLNGETVSGTDGAKPAILSAATGDANSDGTVDRLTLTFSESVVITDPGTDDHITLVASTGSASISAASYGTTASTLVYTITGATANNTSLTIAPTYATSGTGDITDASSNEMLNGETVSGTDGAKPAILSAATGDANSDGTVDRLTLTFSESVVITDPGTDDHITLVASTGSASISAASYGTTASTLVYTITGATANNTSLTIAPTYATSGTGDITDASSNEMLNGETVSGTDGAKPAILSAATGDANSDGTVDRLTLTFSEQVDLSSVDNNNFTLTESVGGSSLAVSSSYSSSDQTSVTLTLTGVTANNTSLTISPNYDDATGTIIDNSSNEMSFSETVTGTDGAAPALVSASYKDTETPIGNAQVDRIDAVFSETLTSSNYEGGDWTFPTNPASLTKSSGAISGNTVQITVTGSPANTTVLGTTTVKYTSPRNRQQHNRRHQSYGNYGECFHGY